jgi:hypothetical protein
LLQQGGPIVSLALLLIGAAIVHWLISELRHQQDTTRELVERLLSCTEMLGRLRPPTP